MTHPGSQIEAKMRLGRVPRGALGASWESPGSPAGSLGASWAVLGGSWGHLDHQNGSKICLGSSLGAGLGAILAPRASKTQKVTKKGTKMTHLGGRF